VLESLRYKAKPHLVKNFDEYFKKIDTPGPRIQIGRDGWFPDYPAASDYFIQLFSCCAPNRPGGWQPQRALRPQLDREIARRMLQTSDRTRGVTALEPDRP